MKKFLILLLLFFIPEVKAEETWTKVGLSMFAPIPGTLAYEMCTKDNFCGMGYFIDARSLVERGNFRYFNLDVIGLNKYGSKTSNKKHSGTGWKVDCENNLLGTKINLNEPSGSAEFDVINFVCSSNKTDSSNKVGSQWRKYGDFNAYWGGIKLDSSYLSNNGYMEVTIMVTPKGNIHQRPILTYKGLPILETDEFINGLEDEIEKTTKSFKLGNKQQEHNLIDALKISCRKFIKEKTGKKPFTNINLVKI